MNTFFCVAALYLVAGLVFERLANGSLSVRISGWLTNLMVPGRMELRQAVIDGARKGEAYRRANLTMKMHVVTAVFWPMVLVTIVWGAFYARSLFMKLGKMEAGF